MDVAVWRERVTTTYQTRRDQVVDLIERIPILGRLVTEFVRIEFIDRCMLIAAQGLLALIPMLVVLSAFLPHLTGEVIGAFSNATGVGGDGTHLIEGEVSEEQVRAQTGIIGLAITIFSATSFARAVQRMYERVWEAPHVGGMSGARRCLLWLLGWMMTLQLAGALRRVAESVGGALGEGVAYLLQVLVLTLIWWATSWILLFGRIAWPRLLVGAAITGVIGVTYNRGASLVMPPYVEANADQFGTLGIILAISTWLIGFAAVLVGAALVGRIISEDPTVVRLATRTRELTEPVWSRLRRRPTPRSGAGTAPPPPAG